MRKQGEDVRIDQSCVIKSDFCAGDHIAIDFGFYCTASLVLYDHVHIGPHCSVIGGSDAELTMHSFSFLAAGCRVICASDEHLGEGIGLPWIPDEQRDNVINQPVVIERFAGVCTGAIIFPGVSVKEGSIIGAGCVVRENTEPWTIYIPGLGNTPMPVKIRPKEKMIKKALELGYDFSS